MTFSLFKPTRAKVEEFLSTAGELNYDEKCGTRGLADEEEVSRLKSKGYRVCRRSVAIGEGWSDYRRAVAKLKQWDHVQLGWTTVVPDAPVKKGSDVCLCARLLPPIGAWVMNPLNTVYVETKRTKVPLLNLVPILPLGYNSSRFSFAAGTKKGHLLAGEERFSVSIDKKDKSVTYEISSLSKPAHLLSRVGYPLVCLLQSGFIRHSTRSMAREMRREKPL